jgi:hypothetical protein
MCNVRPATCGEQRDSAEAFSLSRRSLLRRHDAPPPASTRPAKHFVHTLRTSQATFFAKQGRGRPTSPVSPMDSPHQPRWQAPASISRGTSGAVRTVVMSREKRGAGEDSAKRNSGVHSGTEVDAVLTGSAPTNSSSPQQSAPVVQLEGALRLAPTMHRRSRSAGSMKVRGPGRGSVFLFSSSARRPWQVRREGCRNSSLR